MVIINEKICDNAPECGGIEVCPTGAISWDEKTHKLVTNNDLCVCCRLCVTQGCPIGAIVVTDTVEEYEKELAQIAADKRTVEELFVERYGATAIDEDIIIQKDEIHNHYANGKYLFIEEFNDDSIQCLLHSIPIQTIRDRLNIDFNYYKCDVGVNDSSSIYPTLQLYYEDKYLGKVEGYYDEMQIGDFIKKLQTILKSI